MLFKKEAGGVQAQTIQPQGGLVKKKMAVLRLEKDIQSY